MNNPQPNSILWIMVQRLGFITVDFIIEMPVGIKELYGRNLEENCYKQSRNLL